MAYGTAEVAIQGQIGRWAWIKQNNLISSGTTFWTRVDAAADATYENRVKGSEMTTLDTHVAAGNLGANSRFQPWLTLHHSYFTTDLGYTGLDNWLSTLAYWRVPAEFADMYYEWAASRLTAANIAPSNLTDLGQYAQTGDVFTAGASVDETLTGLGGVRVVVVTKGITDLVMTLTATFNDAASETVTPSVTVAGSAPVGTAYVVGEITPSNNEAAGQTVIEMASTAPFKASQQVLIYDNNAQEVRTIQSLSTNVSITLSSGLRHSYLLANGLKVRALYHHITACTATGGSAGDDINILVAPDRTIAA